MTYLSRFWTSVQFSDIFLPENLKSSNFLSIS